VGAVKIYLAGRIRNDPNYASKFARAADKLRAGGNEVFNPAAANLEGAPLGFIMAHLLPRLCIDADAIALQPGWWRSGGARIEWMLARYLGKKIIWL
jgi:hypothetical protein